MFKAPPPVLIIFAPLILQPDGAPIDKEAPVDTLSCPVFAILRLVTPPPPPVLVPEMFKEPLPT